MDEHDAQFELLMSLESRHEDLLSRLEELDQRVQRVLAECLATREPPPGPVG